MALTRRPGRVSAPRSSAGLRLYPLCQVPDKPFFSLHIKTGVFFYVRVALMIAVLGTVAYLTGAPPFRASIAAPDPYAAIAPTAARAFQSTVRISGRSCGGVTVGSGWVAAKGFAVTNAHVVAGERQPTISVQGVGADIPARVVEFDRKNDIAVLYASELGAVPALRIASEPQPGQSGALLGFPHGGDPVISPLRLGRIKLSLTRDFFGRVRLHRVAEVRGALAPGNSGGPIVDLKGEVIGTIYSADAGKLAAKQIGYAVANAPVRQALQSARALQTADVGGCE